MSQQRHVLRAAPEVASAGDAAAHYGEDEAARYDNTNEKPQAELATRCAALLGLPPAAPALLLDAGCGSCLGWRALAALHGGGGGGLFCLGLDVSRPMLLRAAAAGATRHGDLVLCDLAARLPLREGCTYDGALSVSALQWLCRAPADEVAAGDGAGGGVGGDAEPPPPTGRGAKRQAMRALDRRRKLARAGATFAAHDADGKDADDDPASDVDDAHSNADAPLPACLRAIAARLVPGASFVAQVYPLGRRQAGEMEAAVRATPGLRAGGLVADLPHSAVVAKRFLCLQPGDGDGSALSAPPCPLSWPLQGGCALWWHAAAGVGAPGDAAAERLLRWHDKEARWLARLAAQPPAAAAPMPPRKQQALAAEQQRGAAKAARYAGPGCCAAWRDALAAHAAQPACGAAQPTGDAAGEPA
jgi:SAM-dependent methyltransferase